MLLDFTFSTHTTSILVFRSAVWLYEVKPYSPWCGVVSDQTPIDPTEPVDDPAIMRVLRLCNGSKRR